MSYLERISVALLVVVTAATVLVRVTACSGPAGSQQAPAAAGNAATVIVTADSVNLRQTPDRSASVLARAERGQELELLGTQEDWYNVRWGDRSLWLSKLYASPAEDCSADGAAAPEALLSRLPGEWKGEIGGRPATFIFYARGARLCAYVLYLDVKEALAVETSDTDTLTLSGKRYERLAGTNGEFWLDTFHGRLEEASQRLSGNYSDARNNRGEWYATRPGAVSQEAMTTSDAEEAQLAEPADAGDQTASQPEQDSSQTAPLSDREARQEEEPRAEAPERNAANVDRFIGRWAGYGRQFSPRQRWRLEMDINAATIGNVVGTIEYPSLRCSGELLLTSANEDRWTLRENITQGRGNCVDGGSITMEIRESGQAQWNWYDPQGTLGAQGEVYRRGD
jgi:SH3 domain-containing protein